jgi:Rho family protein
LRPLSYASAHIILIAFSIDTPDSLENAQYKWAEEARRICGSNVPVLLIGCKSDLREAQQQQGKVFTTKEQVSDSQRIPS